jgi:hypothetical protein
MRHTIEDFLADLTPPGQASDHDPRLPSDLTDFGQFFTGTPNAVSQLWVPTGPGGPRTPSSVITAHRHSRARTSARYIRAPVPVANSTRRRGYAGTPRPPPCASAGPE